MSYILTVNNKRYKVFIPGYGVHQVYNSMAAIAAAYEVGISYRDSIKLLPSFKHLNSHFEVMKGLNQCQLIVDCLLYTSCPNYRVVIIYSKV